MDRKLRRLLENYLNNQSSDEGIIILLEYFKISGRQSALRKLIMLELQRAGTPNIKIEGIDQRLDQAYVNVKGYIDQNRVPVVRKVKSYDPVFPLLLQRLLLWFQVYIFSITWIMQQIPSEYRICP